MRVVCRERCLDPRRAHAAEQGAVGVARVLAAATKQLGFDLVLIGDRSADEGQGAVGPAVAEALSVPHLSAALDVQLDDDAAIARRRDDGHVRTLRLPLPALIAVTRSAAEAPSVTLREGAVIESLSLDELGIQAPELRHRLRCVGAAIPADRAPATMLAGAGELIARLRDDRLLP